VRPLPAGGPLLTFLGLGLGSAFAGVLHNAGGDFVPAADLLSLLVQRKKAKKAPWNTAHDSSRCHRSLRSGRQRAGSRAAGARQAAFRQWSGSGRQPAWRGAGRLRCTSQGSHATPVPRPRARATRGIAKRAVGSPVERLLRERLRTTTRSAAIGPHADHRTPSGAFFASFLCTSKEREAAAGPKPGQRHSAKKQSPKSSKGQIPATPPPIERPKTRIKVCSATNPRSSPTRRAGHPPPPHPAPPSDHSGWGRRS